MSIYDTLNEQQKEAVFHTEGPLDPEGSGIGKDPSVDPQDCLFDRKNGASTHE